MANHLRTELVLDALEMAVGHRQPGDVIHQSDQGSNTPHLRSSADAVRRVCDRRWDRSATLTITRCARASSPPRNANAGKAEVRFPG